MHNMFAISMRACFYHECVNGFLNGAESHQAYLQGLDELAEIARY